MKKIKMESVVKNISKNLKKLRLEKGITQVRISQELNMERRGYQKLEYCQNKDIRLSTIIKIMNYYGIGFRKLIK